MNKGVWAAIGLSMLALIAWAAKNTEPPFDAEMRRCESSNGYNTYEPGGPWTLTGYCNEVVSGRWSTKINGIIHDAQRRQDRLSASQGR